MSPLPAGYRAVDVPTNRTSEIIDIDTWAFPSSTTPEKFAKLPLPLTFERNRGVETADGELVAFHSSYPFSEFPVCGTRIPVAGLTWVGVHPGHRRRGLLRSMIQEHFARSIDRGELASALFAAEPAIYGRFGYGLAARSLRLTIPRGAGLRDVQTGDLRVRIEHLDAARHGPVIQSVHAAIERPGWATRQTPELLAAFFNDPEFYREGAESLRIAIVEDAGTPRGYALFRRKQEWDDTGPHGTVRVREVAAQSAAVARALWGVLVDLDLMAKVEVGLLALDDPITSLLVDLRAVSARMSDNLWVRLLDVPRALAARQYQGTVDLVLEVSDELVPANIGRWHLSGGPESAQVEATQATPDLSLDVRDLGAAYLGGTSLTQLAAAGLVTARDEEALHRAAVAFGWPVAPVCSWIF